MSDEITLNPADPCATASALRQAYASLVAGGAVREVVFRAGPNGAERRLSFHGADAGRLLGLVREWEEKCAKASGLRPRRFGLRAGGI